MNDRRRIGAVLLLLAGFGRAQTGMSQTTACGVKVDFSEQEGTIRHLPSPQIDGTLWSLSVVRPDLLQIRI
jgi:hypothetical protein